MSRLASAFGQLQTLPRLFSHGVFRKYATANAISLIGSWMQRVTVGWLAWDLARSGTWLGLIVFAEMFPIIILGPVAGAVADRVNVLVLLRITQIVLLLQAAVLAVLFFTGLLDIYSLFGVSLVIGVNSAFYQSARLSIVPDLVPKADLGAAIAFNAMSFNLARFLGPAAAGVVISSLGVGWGFVGNALSTVVFIAALMSISVDIAHRPKRARKTSLFGDIRDGFAYSLTKPGLPMILLITVVVGLWGRPVVELLPGITSGVFGRGAEGLATLTASVGVGAIAGAFWMMGRGDRPGLTATFLFSALGTAASIGALAVVGSFELAIPVVAAIGLLMVATGIAGQTLTQLTTDDEMRGRVLSIWGILQRGVPAVGSLALGAASDWVGLRVAIAASAVLLAVCAFLALTRASVLARHLDPQ